MASRRVRAATVMAGAAVTAFCAVGVVHAAGGSKSGDPQRGTCTRHPIVTVVKADGGIQRQFTITCTIPNTPEG